MSQRPDPFRSRNGGNYGNSYAESYGGTGDDDYDPYSYNSNTSGSNPYGDTGFSTRRVESPRPPQPPSAPRPPQPPLAPRPPQPPSAPVNPAVRRAERRAGRTGGYGGYAFEADEDDQQRHQEEESSQRPSSIERHNAKRRSGGSPRAFGARNRREGGYGRGGALYNGGGQMEDILQYIQRDWDFMASDNCVPIQIALQLMDESSLGFAHRIREFHDTHQQLQSSLKTIVNEHHQGFNSSIGTFHSIQSSIQVSQGRLRTLKEDLVNAKSHLSTAKPELKGLATSSQNYDDMLQVLSSIEQLQSIPEQLEARISEKRFLSAVELLQDGMRLIRKSEMDKIGALSDLRVYLSNQETSLTDILIEELHSHLYLKSPYCENRWKQYAPESESGSLEQNGSAALARGRKLYQYLDKLDLSVPMVDDATRNPEADTFQYIQLLLEALSNLNRLEEAVETIEHRLPVELFRVVEKCNTEVDQRHPSSLRVGFGKGKLDIPGPNNPRTAVLVDLLHTLFARFEAIAEGHRVVHDVVAGIVKREALQGAGGLTRNFKEMWKLYQSEIRSVLHDYLATDAQAFRTGQDGAGKNIFKKAPRDKTKAIFKLTGMDGKSSDLTMEKEDLDQILKTSVPGLVSESKQSDSPVDTAHLHNTAGGGTGHKLLIEASVFNMGTLLPPALVFLNRLKEVVPPNAEISSGTLTLFLDEFLLNVFLPQMEETLSELCAQIVTEAEAFQEDPLWTLFSQKPIFKGSKKFFDLIVAFCSMLDSLPHDQAFSQLVVTQLVNYHDTCQRWWRDLVARTQPKSGTGRVVKSSAALVKVPDLRAMTEALRTSTQADNSEVIDKETPLLLDTIGRERLEEADLITESKSISAMCLIYTSMKWLASKVSNLRRITNSTADSSRGHVGRPQMQRHWSAVDSNDLKEEQVMVYLPLSKGTAQAFDGAIAQYKLLADITLETLHLEMRTHTIYHLQQSLQEHYVLAQDVSEPDAAVIDLNSDLAAFDEQLSAVLPAAQQSFITTGIGHLMDKVLISMATGIKSMNGNGCGKIQLNILVLQQNLKNVESHAALRGSALYYDLFLAGPDAVIAKAKESGKACGFTYEEMKALLELCYSEALAKEEGAVQAKRNLDEHLLELSEYLY